MTSMDAQLQLVRDRGLPTAEMNCLLAGECRRWSLNIARARLARHPRLRGVFGDEDLAQVALERIWRCLVEYRYICPSCSDADGLFRFVDYEQWQRHLCHVHGKQLKPKVDVGRYVRYWVRLTLNHATEKGGRQARSFASETATVGESLDSTWESLERAGWHMEALRREPDAEATLALKEIGKRAGALLEGRARRMFARLADGMSPAEAARMEGGDKKHRKAARKEAWRLRELLATVAATL